MAHPLTQQPPSSLPFQFAARPSPLAFGFGSPAPSSFATSAASTSSLYTPSRPIGASAFNWQTPSPSTSSRSQLGRLRSAPYTIPQGGSLKRSRQTRSPSSSPPNSPTQSDSLSPRVQSDRATKLDLVQVDQLALRDEIESFGALQKPVKRPKAETQSSSDSVTSDLDVGVMLATLPPSAHLPILLQILHSNPSLTDLVLKQIPPLDPRTCLNELQGIIDKVEKLTGPLISDYDPSINVWETRRWDRVRSEVELFCLTASTYLQHTRAQFRQAPSNPQPLFTLLQFVTNELKTLLRLLPSSSAAHPDKQVANKCGALVEVAQMVLSMWTDWVNELSNDVNQRGGMFPHSLVSTWMDALDSIVFRVPLPGVSESAPIASARSPATAHWSLSSPRSPAGPTFAPQPFVDQFQAAMVPIRNQFVAELGWLVGR